MKITAGLGSVDDYPMYVEAGADECFCGYVPFAWAEKYGVLNPLNRREVRAYNVQIGSYEELKILGNMRKYYQMPVAITFNSLSYTPEQYPVVGEIIGQCHQAGFDTIIVADPALLLYIRSQKILSDSFERRIWRDQQPDGRFSGRNGNLQGDLSPQKYSRRYEILYFQSKKEYRVRGVCPK